MNVKEVAREIDSVLVMKILALNEISGNENAICRFSYAGGKSGYSFGRSQFDVTHNSAARIFLKNKCNFATSEIDRLLKLDKNINDLNNKLSNFRKEIDELDLSHVKEMIKYVGSLDQMPLIDTEKTFIQLV